MTIEIEIDFKVDEETNLQIICNVICTVFVPNKMLIIYIFNH